MKQIKAITNKDDCLNEDNKIKAVIFDFDGVLSSYYVRIAGPIINSAKRFKPDITEKQIEESTLFIFSKMNQSNSKLNKTDILKTAFKMGKQMGLSNFQTLKYLFVSFISYFKFRKTIVPITGAREVIRKLIDQGYKVILVTNTSNGVIKAAKKKIPELELFDLILTRDEFKLMKPNATGFLSAMKTLGLKADEVITIGDQASDILAGKRAGIKTIAINQRSMSFVKSHLVEQNPDFIINDIRQLPNLLRFLRDCIIEDIRHTIDLTEKTLQEYLSDRKLPIKVA
ncbi:MAG: HAD-IA family hydrolase [Asgard group archaeon]|nr:HAD-IA family hydrolase [Asgard group archaeon]